MKYQAYVVQKVGDVPYTIVLGDEHDSVEHAIQAINTYEQYFGKCDSTVIEEYGKEIPTKPRPKVSILETLFKLFR